MIICPSASAPGPCRNDFSLLKCCTSSVIRCILNVEKSNFSEGYLKNSPRPGVRSFNKTSIQSLLEPELYLQHCRKFWPDTPDSAPYTTSNYGLEFWCNLITNFSSRSISYASDQMPALAGLAREFAHPALSSYLARLWTEDLFQGLSWAISCPNPIQATTTSEYLAPSWS